MLQAEAATLNLVDDAPQTSHKVKAVLKATTVQDLPPRKYTRRLMVDDFEDELIRSYSTIHFRPVAAPVSHFDSRGRVSVQGFL